MEPERKASGTFICKTDIDKLKEKAPPVIANRRQSLAVAAKRRLSTGGINRPEVSRKFSTPLMFTRKLSTDMTSMLNGGLPNEGKQRYNRLMSLPAI